MKRAKTDILFSRGFTMRSPYAIIEIWKNYYNHWAINRAGVLSLSAVYVARNFTFVHLGWGRGFIAQSLATTNLWKIVIGISAKSAARNTIEPYRRKGIGGKAVGVPSLVGEYLWGFRKWANRIINGKMEYQRKVIDLGLAKSGKFGVTLCLREIIGLARIVGREAKRASRLNYTRITSNHLPITPN